MLKLEVYLLLLMKIYDVSLIYFLMHKRISKMLKLFEYLISENQLRENVSNNEQIDNR